MAEKERIAGFGKICMNAALVLTASWVPALALLEGAAWATPKVVSAAHYFGLVFMIAAPLAFGARMWLISPPAEKSGALRDWALRCMLPLALFAGAVKGLVLIVPHITMSVILVLMFAGVALGVYGLMMVKEAAAA
ncbi:MAG: hypothetical protein A2506_08535 [Elusimicrobia bacterium RIFOXYD12_FULL_66_9]|nr:MAG: hypothetical protein A2506_08535 [Elusimicrobia bacterium RIFOXYD12_FULL_66_9]